MLVLTPLTALKIHGADRKSRMTLYKTHCESLDLRWHFTCMQAEDILQEQGGFQLQYPQKCIIEKLFSMRRPHQKRDKNIGKV